MHAKESECRYKIFQISGKIKRQTISIIEYTYRQNFRIKFNRKTRLNKFKIGVKQTRPKS